jgi:UDP-N-acetylmuramoyl-tripeptide--D-alanyl-D-alanine ligase
MIRLTAEEVATATRGRLVGDGAVRIDDVSTDTRQLVDGALFVALRGESADGHDHLPDALRRGAGALLVEREVPEASVPVIVVADTWRALADLGVEVRQRVGPRAVAITGSVGKTTTKDLIAAAVGAGRRVVAARGSFNNELGVPLTMLSLEQDTEVLVTEIGARHVGDIAALAPLVAPEVAVVTAVAPVHLEVFGSVEAVARGKAELVESLGPDGVAVLNLENDRVAAMADRAPRVLGYAIDADADVRASDVTLDESARASFTAVTPWGRARVRLPLAGRHHVGNALAALAVAGHLGVDLADAAAALEHATVSPWRGEVLDAGGVRVLNDAYNANPTATIAALETLTAIQRNGRSWAVLGTMAEIGDEASGEHERVGERCAALGVDRLVAVGEHAHDYAAGAATGGLDAEAVAEVADADAALEHLLGRLEPGDAVLVKASRVAGLERVATGLVERREGGA